MIFAELRGKLGGGQLRAHERSEDALTSTAFGLLRYLPFDQGIGALLQRVRVASMQGEEATCTVLPNWIRSSSGLLKEIEFWPRLRRGGEPDLRLTMDDGKEVVLIEAKLHSGKSPIAENDEDDNSSDEAVDAEPPLDPDQLVRYFQGQCDELIEGGRVSLVYLTAHAVPPLSDLTESLRRCPEMRLGWLSWRDVWAVAASGKQIHASAADLAALLAHKGLAEFHGFRAERDLELVYPGRFWAGPTTSSRSSGPFFTQVRDVPAPGWVGQRGRFFDRPTGRPG